jgi:pimeloyl-ACP methyl ester carboxylesterase
MTTQTQPFNLHPDIQINATITSPPRSASPHSLPTPILLHFWGGSSRTWSLLTPLLAQGGYPTIALDLRGWGDSTGPSTDSGYTISAQAEDVETIITKYLSPDLTKGGIILIGLSMGAKIAQLIASRGTIPFLKGLVLISPAPTTPLTLPPDMREQQLHAYDDENSAGFVARNVLTLSFRDGSRELPAFVVEDMLRGNSFAKRAWPAYGMGEDVSAGVSGISVPTLVLAADGDVVEPVERVRKEVVERISGSRLVVLTRSGHLSPLDVPGAVAENLLGFLRGL